MSTLGIARPTGFFARLARWAPVRFVVLVLALVGILALASLIGQWLIPPAPSPWHRPLAMLLNVVAAGAALGAYALVVRVLERRSANELDPRTGALPFLGGILVGTLLMASVYAVLWSLGMARFGAASGLDGLGSTVIALLCGAILEELLLRAVLFRIVEQAGGTASGIVVSAVVFGALHGANPGATLWSDAAIAIEAGIMLALAYALTRNLWLAIGIHLGWNFAEGFIFGAEVSGTKPPHSLMSVPLTGPDLLTGGSFGPEASILSMGVCLIAAAVLAVLVVRRGNWLPARLRLRSE
jgi:membrane protease YdiL (CAAX protease family)